MSLIIAVYGHDSVSLCSEDRVGIWNEAGQFVPIEDVSVKSIRINRDIIFGATGTISLADSMKAFVGALSHLSFGRLAGIITTVAPALMKQARSAQGLPEEPSSTPGKNEPQLGLILAGWDSERKMMRGIVWHHLEGLKPVEAVMGETYASLVGAEPEVHEMAAPALWHYFAGPEDFRPLYSMLADAFPIVGRGLTIHTVTRPEENCLPAGELRGHLTAGDKAFTNINNDGTYKADKYHASAARFKTSSGNFGSHTFLAGGGAYVTVASFHFFMPADYSQYLGDLKLELTSVGGTVWTFRARIVVGSNVSNEIVLNSPSVGPTNGTVTVTGITGGAEITVNVQIEADASLDGGTTAKATFTQIQYTDQDTSNLA